MNDPSPLEHDALAAWLAVSRSDSASLRQAVLHRTTRLLRRRRWQRRGAVVLALAACYVAGLVTMRWLTPLPAAETIVVEKTTQAAPPPPEAPPPQQEAEPPARALEWKALDHPQITVEYYRRAGDRYLAESNDMQAAVRCYKQMLDAGSEHDLIIAPDDTWLLMALKEARQKEKLDAKAN
jgi:hypothetical protein